MNDDSLNQLFDLARRAPRGGDTAAFGFETRMLARLRAEREEPSLSSLAWRLCPWLAAVTAAVALWTVINPPELSPASTQAGDELLLAEQFTGTSL